MVHIFIWLYRKSLTRTMKEGQWTPLSTETCMSGQWTPRLEKTFGEKRPRRLTGRLSPIPFLIRARPPCIDGILTAKSTSLTTVSTDTLSREEETPQLSFGILPIPQLLRSTLTGSYRRRLGSSPTSWLRSSEWLLATLSSFICQWSLKRPSPCLHVLESVLFTLWCLVASPLLSSPTGSTTALRNWSSPLLVELSQRGW